MNETDFDTAFEALTGNRPFPWQFALYQRLVAGDIPPSCNLPTGLGKTSVIPIWLIALAKCGEKLPRRLVYVVNRRTVVDQATREAEKLRATLLSVDTPVLKEISAKLAGFAGDPTDGPLAISTLRGDFADNGDWRADPARPAVIVGTIDMIGSRLLFSGYGAGFKSRPLHAGFLGQDVLLVHDEAHLEPAFQCLLTEINAEQKRRRELLRFHVMELTATSRSADDQFRLAPQDLDNETVRRRMQAKKRIELHETSDAKKTADEVAKLALAHKDSGQAILVFLRALEDVEKVAGKMPKGMVERLTGTLRGHERDQLATKNPIFARFLPVGEREGRESTTGTVYLVCTSAGEVGVNISADHLVCDLAPFDSMAQRFGRVNRFGDGDARIDVVHPASFDENDEYELRRKRTLELLRRLDHNASPEALGALPDQDRQTAFSPSPEILPADEVLFDAWALTSVREALPGRPIVEDWLHGIPDRFIPDTYVAWREEVGVLHQQMKEADVDEDRARFERFAAELLGVYPVKPHELLRDRTDRVIRNLDSIADRTPELPSWVVQPDGRVAVYWLRELGKKDRQNKPAVNLASCTVLLPPVAGGLKGGTLNGTSAFGEEPETPYDVADEWFEDEKQQRRKRLWGEGGERPRRMRLVQTLDIAPLDDEGEGTKSAGARVWRWYVRVRSADDVGSTGLGQLSLRQHLADAEAAASKITRTLGLPESLRRAVVLASKFHDLGKCRAVWQRAIGNTCYDPGKLDSVLAKSGHSRPPEDLNHYRHEFGSLLDVVTDPDFHALKDESDMQDVILHLIAAHHGRARPHFAQDEAFDPEHGDDECERIACETPRRFARLQRKYGRWGLAYLESLVRAADISASQPSKEAKA
jgi:CRISPR-associated endonuclease/helicase Cas3